jgi:hypothetical protein
MVVFGVARAGAADDLENQYLDVFIVDAAVYALGYLAAAHWGQQISGAAGGRESMPEPEGQVRA